MIFMHGLAPWETLEHPLEEHCPLPSGERMPNIVEIDCPKTQSLASVRRSCEPVFLRGISPRDISFAHFLPITTFHQ